MSEGESTRAPQLLGALLAAQELHDALGLARVLLAELLREFHGALAAGLDRDVRAALHQDAHLARGATVVPRGSEGILNLFLRLFPFRILMLNNSINSHRRGLNSKF